VQKASSQGLTSISLPIAFYTMTVLWGDVTMSENHSTAPFLRDKTAKP
jgi:hypothetical protein